MNDAANGNRSVEQGLPPASGRARDLVKICGITSPEDARAATEAGADFIGLVFAESRRRIELAVAEQIIGGLPASVGRVGLFVNAPQQSILEIAEQLELHIAQLHGEERPQDYRQVLQRMPVWKSVPMRSSNAGALVSAWENTAAALLFDSGSAQGIRGGSGEEFDWRRIPRVQCPLVLAGGLRPENVAEAIASVRPWAVDVSTGVESAPGVKDASRVRAFVEAAREAFVAVAVS